MISHLMSRRVIVITIVAFSIIGGLGYWKYGPGKAPPAQAAFVTEAVRKGILRVTVSATGAVTGEAEVEIKPEVSGTISKVAVVPGQTVKVGDTLVHLSNDSLIDQAAQARIDLEMARLKLSEMKNPASKATDAQIEIARAKLDQAQSLLNKRILEVAELTVVTGLTGQVDGMTVQPGTWVNSNSVIGRILDTSKMVVVFPVNETYVNSLRVGMAGTIMIRGETERRPVTVVEIVPVGKQSGNSSSFDVKLEVNNPGGVLKTGMIGLVYVDIVELFNVSSVGGYGYLQPYKTKDIVSKVSGEVKKVFVSNQDRVVDGQTVVILENRDLALNRNQAEIEFRSARDVLDSLINPPATSTEADIRTQELRVKQLELSLATKEREVDKLVVRAPINGTVISENANVGDRVGQGGSALVTLGDYSNMYLTISVDELDVGKVRPGQRARVTVDALNGKTFNAEVVQIAPAGTVSQGVANFGVLLGLKETDGLISGMTGQATIFVAEKSGVLLVPLEAIQGTGERSMVRVLRESTPQPVQVRTGLANDTHVEVVSGLAEGDMVVAGTVSAAGPALRGFGGMGGGGIRIREGGPPGGGPPGGSQPGNRAPGGGGSRGDR